MTFLHPVHLFVHEVDLQTYFPRNSVLTFSQSTTLRNQEVSQKYLFQKRHLFIYLLGCARSQLWHANSVEARRLQFPHQDSDLGPLHWEHGVLATGPLGKSQKYLHFRFLWGNWRTLAKLGPHSSLGVLSSCPIQHRSCSPTLPKSLPFSFRLPLDLFIHLHQIPGSFTLLS